MKQAFEKYKQLIPALVMAIICCSTIATFLLKPATLEINGETYWLTANGKHYAAFAAVAVCLISFFVYRPIYKFALGATLLLGLFDLINFTPEDNVFSFGINSFQIGIQPTSACIIILLAIINLKEIRTRRSENFQTIEPSPGYSQDRFNAEVEKFKEKYKAKTSDELTQILSDKRFTQAALDAAQQILNDRKTATSD